MTKTGQKLYNIVQAFLNDTSSNPTQFVDDYFDLWRNTYRFSEESHAEDPDINEVFSSLFCITDQFCEDETIRDEYELNEAQLREQVAALIARIKV